MAREVGTAAGSDRAEGRSVSFARRSVTVLLPAIGSVLLALYSLSSAEPARSAATGVALLLALVAGRSSRAANRTAEGRLSERARLLERDPLFRELVGSPLAIALIDERAHRLIEANEAWGDLVGLPAERELRGVDLDAIDPVNTAWVSEQLAACARAGERSWTGRATITRPDGSLAEADGWIIGLEEGREPFGRTLSFWIDRTAERGRDALIAGLAESSIGVVHVGPDRRIIAVNEAWCTMTGESAERVVGRLVSEVDPEGSRRIRELREAHPGRSWTGEVLLARTDGEVISVEGRIVDLPGGGSVGLWIDRSAQIERDHIMRALEAAPVGFIVIDEESDRIISVNRAWCEMTGYRDPAEVVGRSAAEIDPDAGAQMGDFRERRERNLPWHGQIRLRRADGSSFPAEGYSISTRLPDGPASRSVNFWIDRSAQRSNDRLEEALRLIPLGAAEIDDHGRVVWSNEAWRSLAGWSLTGAVVDDHEGRALIENDGLRDALVAGRPWEREIEIIRPRGGRTPVMLTILPSSLIDERHFIAFLADRSERAAREHEFERIRLDLERMVTALAATGLVIVIRSTLDEDQRIDWVNRAFERLTGRDAESVLGRRADEFDPQYAREISRRRGAAGRANGPLRGESTLARVDGSRLAIRYELISLPAQGATYTFAIDRSVEQTLEERLARLARAEGVLDESRAALAAIEAQATLALGLDLDRELRSDLEAIAEAARRGVALLA